MAGTSPKTENGHNSDHPPPSPKYEILYTTQEYELRLNNTNNIPISITTITKTFELCDAILTNLQNYTNILKNVKCNGLGTLRSADENQTKTDKLIEYMLEQWMLTLQYTLLNPQNNIIIYNSLITTSSTMPDFLFQLQTSIQHVIHTYEYLYISNEGHNSDGCSNTNPSHADKEFFNYTTSTVPG